jgi:hypothetical protein
VLLLALHFLSTPLILTATIKVIIISFVIVENHEMLRDKVTGERERVAVQGFKGNFQFQSWINKDC